MKSGVGMECWINDCARPRVDEVCCAVHGGKPKPPPVSREGAAKVELLAMLRSDGPLRLSEMARRRRVSMNTTQHTLIRLLGEGRVRRIERGVYAVAA